MVKRILFCCELGQSMLEIMVLLTILVVVTSTVAMVSINSIKNSQFSKNQIQATQLAQEGIDKVKTGRSKNCQVSIDQNLYYWYDNASLIWDTTIASEINYKVDLDSSPCKFDELISSQSDTISQSLNSKFKRKITLIDDGVADRKKVKSEVSWVDSSGTHSSVNVTILTKN